MWKRHRSGLQFQRTGRPALLVLALAAGLLSAPWAHASTSVFTNTGTVCTTIHPCSAVTPFTLLVGITSTSTGAVGFSNNSSTDYIGGTLGGAIGFNTGSTINTGTRTETFEGPVDFADSSNLHSSGNCPNSSHKCSIPGTDTMTNATVQDGSVVTGSSAPGAALSEICAGTNCSSTTGIYGYWVAQTPTSTINSLGQAGHTTITGNGGLQVIDVNGNLTVNSGLTISGGANDLIIINVTGNANITKPITLTGGLLPDQVLFDIETISGTALTINAAGAIVSGDFIVRGSENISNANIDGRILGGSGAISIGNNVLIAPSPEPATWAFMIGGAGALFYLGRRRLPTGKP